MTGRVPPNIAAPRLRLGVPSGYVLGRTSPSTGPAEFIPMAALGNALNATGVISAASVNQAYLGFVLEGPFAYAKQFIGAISHAPVTFPSSSIASIAQALTAPTANFTIYLVNNLTTFLASGAPTGCLAHIDFTAASNTGTVTWYAGSTLIATNTVLYICFPNDFDVTLAKVILLFAGDL